MDQTKSIKLQKKRLESAEERRARLDKNNEKARAKSRTETEQKKILFDVPDSELRSTSLLKKSRVIDCEDMWLQIFLIF